jgi:hypothetical protein
MSVFTTPFKWGFTMERIREGIFLYMDAWEDRIFWGESSILRGSGRIGRNKEDDLEERRGVCLNWSTKLEFLGFDTM